MKTLRGRTAVITGAGSGLGREFARACAAEGMNLLLADLHQAGLDETLALAELADTEALTWLCDVSKADQVEALAVAAESRFGPLHLIFNNAGVGVTGPLWTSTLDEWDWVLGVNLMGVVHGVRSFVPRLLAHGDEAHVVNTASIAGLICGLGQGVYSVSKHAVVALSEVLYHELQAVQSRVGVSVLCPAFVPTGIAESGQHRPSGHGARNPHPMTDQIEQMVRSAVSKGRISASEVADLTLQAVRDERFYILPHAKTLGSIESRMRHILEGRPPHDPMSGGPG